MLSEVFNGLSYSASFFLSYLPTEIWATILIGSACAAILALAIGVNMLNAVAISSSVVTAAAILTIFAIPLCLGIYFMNRSTESNDLDEEPQCNTPKKASPQHI